MLSKDASVIPPPVTLFGDLQPKAPAKRSPNGPRLFLVTPHALFNVSCAEAANSVAFFCSCSPDCCVEEGGVE